MLSLPNRVNQQALPEIDIVDMREELSEGNRSMFSKDLREAIQLRLDRQEQVVLFLNRRGYASFMLSVGIVDMYRNVQTVIFH